jgi:FkbM family methyltransferase
MGDDRVTVVGLIDKAPAALAARMRAGTRPARALAWVANPFLPRVETVVTVRSGAAAGLRIPIQPRREKFYWTGAYELEVQRALVRFLRPGMTFWDVGAHAGFMTLLASRLVGAGGRVHAFEPAERSRARLRAALRANDTSNVIVHDVAVGATSGTATLYSHGTSSMWTTVAELGDAPVVDVTARTLDDLADELGTPDLIKVDVEGAETDVLCGARRLLAAGRSKLVVEFSSAALLDQARSVFPQSVFTQLDESHWLLEGRAQ